MTMSRTKRIAIGMLIVFGLELAMSFFIPQPFSLIITSIVVVLVLDWLWNRRKIWNTHKMGMKLIIDSRSLRHKR